MVIAAKKYFAKVFLAVGLMLTFSTTAFAYLDPSVMIYASGGGGG